MLGIFPLPASTPSFFQYAESHRFVGRYALVDFAAVAQSATYPSRVSKQPSLPSPSPVPLRFCLPCAACLLAFAWPRCRVRQFAYAVAVILVLAVSASHADAFNMPDGQTSLQFVTPGA